MRAAAFAFPTALVVSALICVGTYVQLKQTRARSLLEGANYAGTAYVSGHELLASITVTHDSLSLDTTGLIPITCPSMPYRPLAPEVEIEDEVVNHVELLSPCVTDALASYGQEQGAPLMSLTSLDLVPERTVALTFSYRGSLPITVHLERLHAGQEGARANERKYEALHPPEHTTPCVQACLKDEHDVASRRSSFYLTNCRQACAKRPVVTQAAEAHAKMTEETAPWMTVKSLFDAAARLRAHAGLDAVGATPSGVYEGSMKLFSIKVDATMRVKSDTKLDLKIVGTLALECDDEDYNYADGVIDISGSSTPGDCVYDAVTDNGVEWGGATYDAKSDRVTATVVYGGAPIPLVLNKQTLEQDAPSFSDAVRMEALHAHATSPACAPPATCVMPANLR